MSISLECRLLCASMTAYSVTNDGPSPHSSRISMQRNADDITPFLPPSLAFRHVCSVPFAKPYVHRFGSMWITRWWAPLCYITRAGAIVADSPMLRFERYTSLAGLLITGGFEQIAKD
ncbi:MAG: hypothetical protein LC749_09410, partial [Actinobacteria bacterium]|nr:hypothetical protein [Actinomycetota bacterium]